MILGRCIGKQYLLFKSERQVRQNASCDCEQSRIESALWWGWEYSFQQNWCTVMLDLNLERSYTVLSYSLYSIARLRSSSEYDGFTLQTQFEVWVPANQIWQGWCLASEEQWWDVLHPDDMIVSKALDPFWFFRLDTQEVMHHTFLLALCHSVHVNKTKLWPFNGDRLLSGSKYHVFNLMSRCALNIPFCFVSYNTCEAIVFQPFDH